MATIRPGTFQELPHDHQATGERVSLALPADLPAEKIRCITSEHRPSRKQKIEDADIVIAGGRGMGSKGKFKKLFELAGLMHGDVAIVADANQVCLGIIRALKEKIRD